jgi:tryptophanyl-tRNA synthetase
VVFAFHRIYNENYSEREKECRNGSIGCVNCKKDLFEILNKIMKEIDEKRNYYISNRKKIEEIIENGNKKASEVAAKKFQNILKVIKLR